MNVLVRVVGLAGLLLAGGILGFFYAWVCSTMWGLDQAPPHVAIEAMQAMNASVRNAVFAPAFFATPVVLLLAAVLSHVSRLRQSAFLFGSAALVYFCFGMLLTMLVNVPMNEALAVISVPSSPEEAADVWAAYSEPWQFWNQMRTIASGISLLLCGLGLMSVERELQARAA